VAHEAEIFDSADAPLDGMKFWCDADDPYCFLAFCFEYTDYKRNPKDFVSHISVQQDGSCSGLQHYSALLKDNVGGKVVNLLPAKKKFDVYAEVATIVNEQLNKELYKKGEDYENIEAWLKHGVDRKLCKRNVMTFCYGATRTGFTQQLVDYIRKEKITLDIPSGNIVSACNTLAGHNWRAIEQTLVKSVEAMSFLQKLAFLMAKGGLEVQWVSPIGLKVSQDYRKTTTKKINTYWGQTRIQPTFAKIKKQKDAVGSRNGIAPNYIHSLDASHLMLTLLKCSELGIESFSFIHDSFGTHAGDMETMSRVLRETFVEMYSGNLLEKFVEDIHDQIPEEMLEEFYEITEELEPEMGILDVKEVLKSTYFFS